MGQLKAHHRPLTGGLGIQRKDEQGHHGTLTAVARRQDDNEPVLVTNLHVVSSSGIYGVDGDEAVYQWHANKEKAGTLYTRNGRQSWGRVALNDSTSIDVAALAVEAFQGYDFGVHEHDSDGNHRKRPIVQPVREPKEDESLVQIGARSGVQRVTVVDPDTRYSYTAPGEFLSYKFANVVRINRGENSPIDRGDSGAPLLYEDDDGNYHLCCINFAAERNSDGTINRDVGYAIPASAAQRALNITFGVQAPIADAGDGGTVVAGEQFSLDGRGSRAVETGATIADYRWEQTHLTAIPSRGTDTAQPTFTAPSSSSALTFKLTVTDSNGAKHSTTVDVTVVPNTPPVAKPGPNRVVNINSPVTLVGAAEDPDTGHIKGMTYAWSVTSAPSDNAGSSARSTTGTPSSRVTLAPVEGRPAQRTFTPKVIGDYTFTLTVTDPGDLSHSDTMKVKAVRESENLLPTNISALPAADIIDFSWNSVSLATGYELQVGVAEDGGEIGYASYTTTALTHRVENLAEGTRYYYRVRMTNADGVGPWSAVASVVTAIPANHIPIANAGADQTVEAGASVTLDGSGSSDQDGDTLTYLWKQVKGPKVTLSGADTVRATFTAPSSATTLRFRLTVTDEHGSKAINAVIITVTAPTPTPKPPPPTNPPTPPPPCTWTDTGETRNSAFSEWVDADETRNRVEGAWADTGNMRENQVLLILEKEQTRTINWEKKQTRIHSWQKKQECVSQDSTETRWVDASSTQTQWPAQSRTETRWVACEWEDVSSPETRNRVEGDWTDTGNQRENQTLLIYEKEQTRTITWEKKQQCTGGGDTSYQWVNASDTETQWVVIPEECGSWTDTGQTRVSSYGTYSRTGSTRGSGSNRECEESRTNQREKELECTTNAPYNNRRTQWISTTSTTQTRWVSCPDPWGEWTDTGSRRVKSYGGWSDTGQRHYDDMEDRYYKEQERTLTWEKQQKRTSQSGNSSQTRWVNDGTSTETRWVVA